MHRGPNTSDLEKAQLLCEHSHSHSERLALVYGLLYSTDKQPITMYNNLRVCGDCHTATKYVSRLLERKITVKDANRWHVFENGKCACGEFW